MPAGMDITNGCLVVTAHAELYDDVLNTLIDDILLKVSKFSLKAVILDVSAVRLLDAHIASVFRDLARMTRLMGALTVLVGLRASVACTVADLDIPMDGVITTTNRDMAFKIVEGYSDLN